jgi:hypothetical protein
MTRGGGEVRAARSAAASSRTAERRWGFLLAGDDLKDGKIGEIRYAVEKGDEKGHAAALKILDSFRAP